MYLSFAEVEFGICADVDDLLSHRVLHESVHLAVRSEDL